jgi:hypothetical protein
MYYVDGHHLLSPDRLQVRIITDSGPCSGDEVFTLMPLLLSEAEPQGGD